MKLQFTRKNNKDYILIDEASITYRNFSGAPSQYNREGDRNFALIIPDMETANALIDNGWNVKIKPPRDEDDYPFITLPVKLKFSEYGPTVYLRVGENGRQIRLDEESVSRLDRINIVPGSVGMDIRAYDWEMPGGRTGRTAYLELIEVVQNVDRFAARYEDEEF